MPSCLDSPTAPGALVSHGQVQLSCPFLTEVTFHVSPWPGRALSLMRNIRPQEQGGISPTLSNPPYFYLGFSKSARQG
jgi:hypothetical protein